MRSIYLLGMIVLIASCMPLQQQGSSSSSPSSSGAAQSSSTSALMSAPIAPYTAGNKTPYQVFGEVYEVMPDSFGYLEIGVSSWYGKKFHGRKTSNGEIFDMHQISAAHKTLPIPSMVKVTNLDNGKHVILRINDRGPFYDNRIIDLSYAAAKAIGFSDQGLAPVVVEALDDLNHPQRYAALHGEHHTKFYLQLGAFSDSRWAQGLKQQVDDLFLAKGKDVNLKILQSENASGILHKVWLGPMADETQREEIAAIVEAAQLGKPINVEVQ